MRKRSLEIRFILYLIILILFFTDVPSALALYIHVNPGQTIQGAINSANNGDVIIVYQGTYYERINFFGKAITIRSSNPDNPFIVANTIIDGGKAGSVVTFNNSEKEDSVLSGFTIQNGKAEYGGGIYCESSKPSINKCVIKGNSAISYYAAGGGICLFGCSSYSIINECIITENTSEFEGGGIHCQCASATINNCTFSKNSASLYGGGISFGGTSNPVITNCNIIENSAAHGGGISSVYSDGIIIECIITKNLADYGGYCNSSKSTFNNCTIRDNSATHEGGGIVTE